MTSPPTDNLIRARYGGDTIEMRAADDGRTLFGHFSVFDTWTQIDSHYEGKFLERIKPGSFRSAFEDPKSVRVLYEHGADPDIGTKPIGAPVAMREDDIGAYYEAELFDTPYANQLLPALRSGQLGASFRFSVLGEEWVTPSRASEHNPDKLPERTISDVRLYEFGPVTWGAYPDATAGVRSGTDAWHNRLHRDPLFAIRYADHVGRNVAESILLSSVPSDHDSTTPGTADSLLTTINRDESRRRAELVRIADIVRHL